MMCASVTVMMALDSPQPLVGAVLSIASPELKLDGIHSLSLVYQGQ
jgi:hypothetical protein